MKTRLLIIIGIIFSSGFVIVGAYADCNINTDWPDAPCMDEGYQQHLVKKWAEYFNYKGERFMDSKRMEMNDAIKDNRLLDWIDQSIQNQNVWQYYYFTGMAPNPYPYLQNMTFEPNVPVLTTKMLSEGILDCIEGYKQDGPECVPDDTLTISYGHQWILKIILIIAILIAIPVGIIFGVRVWRKRK